MPEGSSSGPCTQGAGRGGLEPQPCAQEVNEIQAETGIWGAAPAGFDFGVIFACMKEMAPDKGTKEGSRCARW